MEKKLLIKYVDVDICQQDVVVLSNVQLEVHSGEFLYLLGKVGSGKTSLLKSMYHEVPVSSGVAGVLGYDLTELKLNEVPFLRRKIGIVFQDFQLLSDRNVQDNLVFALKATGWTDDSKIKSQIDDVMNLVGLKTKGFKMPYELSGGEQQRVVIARALLNSPELILADEPTGNLDPETSDEIIQLLQQIARDSNTSMLIASHDFMMMQKFPSRTIRCENGKVMEVNSTANTNSFASTIISNEPAMQDSSNVPDSRL